MHFCLSRACGRADSGLSRREEQFFIFKMVTEDPAIPCSLHNLPPCYHSRMPSLMAVGIIVLALLIAAALFLMYEIGRPVGEKTATDKFPEQKKAAVRRSRSALSGMFAEQLAPYLPNFPFSPTEAKFIGAPIDFLVFRGMDDRRIEEVIFVEAKSGSARLNHNEHSLKETIDNKRVRWHEYHVPAPVTHSPNTIPEPTL
jgi:hypothetical protein